MEKRKKVIVQKYGGTSVATTERIKIIANRIKQIKENSDGEVDIVLIVSAMGKETDRLTSLANEITETPHQREMDMLLTAGERISMSLMSMALQDIGIPAISFTGSQCGIVTDTSHTKAKIVEIKGFRVLDELNKGKVVVIAGFQGVSPEKEVTTLGRGGSDTTAVAIAVYLKADVCEIYTDVNGVYTADPRIIPNAKLIKKCCYEEMMEMALLGASVLHYRSVEIAERYNIHLIVKSSFTFEDGTEVTNKEVMEKVLIRNIVNDRDISRITILSIPDEIGATYSFVKPLSDANVTIKLMMQSNRRNDEQDLSFVILRSESQRAVKALYENTTIDKNNIIVNNGLARISLVGYGLVDASGTHNRIFKSLAEKNVCIYDISSSNISISFLVDEEEAELAVTALHNEFEEDFIKELDK